MASRTEHYCAFCSLLYRSYTQRHAGWKEALLATVFSMVMMWTLWGGFHVFGVVVWIAMLAWSETFLRIRWRASLKCTHCGFDPMLYKTSPERAAASVKEFLAQRKQDPGYLLKPQPILPPRRTAAGSKPSERPKPAEM